MPADANDSHHAGALGLASEEDLERVNAGTHGRTRGQIDGTPEYGDSFFDVAE